MDIYDNGSLAGRHFAQDAAAYHATALRPGHWYGFSVVACNTAGCSPQSGRADAQVPLHISDEYLKALVAGKGGVGGIKAEAAMKTRFMLPEPGIPTNLTYFTSSSDSQQYNWSGYVSNPSPSHQVTGVQGDVTVATVPSGAADTAGWTGVGGFNGPRLAQTGYSALYHDAWWELYDANGDPSIPGCQANSIHACPVFSVKENDDVYSDVIYDGESGDWLLTVEDDNSGAYFGDEFNFSPSPSTADWILEFSSTGTPTAPSNNSTFSNAYWEDENGAAQTVNSDEDVKLARCVMDRRDSSGHGPFAYPILFDPTGAGADSTGTEFWYTYSGM